MPKFLASNLGGGEKVERVILRKVNLPRCENEHRKFSSRVSSSKRMRINFDVIFNGILNQTMGEGIKIEILYQKDF